MKCVSLLRVAALACNNHVMYVTHKITLSFPDNVSNMTYSYFFLKSGTGLRTAYSTVTSFEHLFYKYLELLPL